jgi:hypothetical protein
VADQAVEEAERHGRKRRRTRPAWSRRRSNKWTLQLRVGNAGRRRRRRR